MPESILPQTVVQAPDYPSIQMDKFSNGGMGFGTNPQPVDTTQQMLSSLSGSTPSKDALSAPTYFDWDKTNADRYVNSNYYKSLGFDPNIGQLNEYKYADAQSAWDQSKKAFTGFFAGAWDMFKDQATSWGDVMHIFSDPTTQSMFKEDEMNALYEQQTKFNNAYPIFESQKDQNNFFTWGNFMRKAQGLGPIVGAIGEVAAEEAVLSALTAATFGGTSELQAAALAKEASTIPNILKNSERFAQSLDGVGNIRRAWEGFKTTPKVSTALDVLKEGAFSVKNILPIGGNTVEFAKNFETIKNIDQLTQASSAMGTLRTVSRGFGSFYRDLRELNMAVTMSSGNAASTYHQLKEGLAEDFKTKMGRDPNSDESDNINNTALEAAKKTGALDNLAILYTNKLAFGNLLKGFKPLEQTIAESGSGLFKGITVLPDWLAKKEGANKLLLKGENKWMDWKAKLFSVPYKFAELGTHGLGFGTQIPTLNALDDAVKTYYQARYDKKNYSWGDAIKQSIDKQFSKEGVESFISAFATGMVIGGAGHVVREGIPNLFQRLTDRQGYDTLKAARKENATKFVQDFNEVWKNPQNPLKKSMSDVNLQANFKAGMEDAVRGKDKKIYNDTYDDSLRDFVLSSIRNGTIDTYLDRLKDYTSNLSKQELVEAFDMPKTDVDKSYNDIQERLQDFTKRTHDLKNSYNDIWSKFPNPYNPWKYKPGTSEYQNEVLKFASHEEAVHVAAFMKDQTQRAIERQDLIFNGKSGVTGIRDIPGIKDLAFSTIYSFTSPGALDNEMAITRSERDAEEGQRARAQFNTKLENLDKHKQTLTQYQDAYRKILQEPTNSVEQSEAISLLNKEYSSHLQDSLRPIIDSELRLAKKEPISDTDLKAASERFLDYYQLGVEHKELLPRLNFILDPSNFKNWSDLFEKWQTRANEITPTQETTVEGTVEEIKPVPEDLEKQRKEKVAEQVKFLDAALQDSTEKIRQAQEERASYQDKIDSITKKLAERKIKLEEALRQLQQWEGKKGRPTKEMKAVREMKDTLSSEIQELESALDLAKIQKDRIDTAQKGLERISNYYNKGLRELRDSSHPFSKETTQEARELYERTKEQFSDKIPLDKLMGIIDNLQKEGEVLKSNINSIIDANNAAKETLKSIVSSTNLYDKLIEAKGPEKLRELTSELLRSPDSTPEEKQVLKAILKNLNQSVNADTSLDKPIVENLANVISRYNDTLEKLLGKQTETGEELGKMYLEKSAWDQLDGLEKTSDYLNTLQEGIGLGEQLIKQWELDDKLFEDQWNEENTKWYTNTGANPEAPEESKVFDYSRNKYIFTPGILNKTAGRQLHPEHFEIQLESNKVARFGIDRSDSENPHVFLLDEKRYTPQEVDELKALGRSIDVNNPPTGIEGKKVTYRANDEELNLDDRNAQWGKFANDINLPDTEAKFWPVNKDNDSFGIVNTQAYPEDIKLIAVNKEGLPIDRKGEIIKNPSKNNLFFVSMHGGDDLFSDNPNKVFRWMENKFAIPEDTSREEVLAEADRYKKQILKLREQLKNKDKILLSPDGKTFGPVNILPKDKNGKVQKLPLEGRLLEKDTDYITPQDPNGMGIQFKLSDNGRVYIQREDGAQFRVYNRALKPEETLNLKNTLKLLSHLYKKNPQQVADTLGVTKEEASKKLAEIPTLQSILHNTIFYRPPAKGEKLQVNRLWIDKNNKINRSYRTENDSIQVHTFDFNAASIEQNWEKLLGNMFHQVNIKTLDKPLESYSEYKVDDNLNITEEKRWDNYLKYLVSTENDREPVLHSNVVRYSEYEEGKPDSYESRIKQVSVNFTFPDEYQKTQAVENKQVTAERLFSKEEDPLEALNKLQKPEAKNAGKESLIQSLGGAGKDDLYNMLINEPVKKEDVSTEGFTRVSKEDLLQKIPNLITSMQTAIDTVGLNLDELSAIGVTKIEPIKGGGDKITVFNPQTGNYRIFKVEEGKVTDAYGLMKPQDTKAVEASITNIQPEKLPEVAPLPEKPKTEIESRVADLMNTSVDRINKLREQGKKPENKDPEKTC